MVTNPYFNDAPTIPRTKDEYLGLPYNYRIQVDRTLNDNGLVAPINGQWDVGTETAIQAYNQNKSLSRTLPPPSDMPLPEEPAKPNPQQDKAKQYREQGKNPVLAYINSTKPEYDIDKEKRLKNLAILDAIGGVVQSIVNTAGVNKGALPVNMQTNQPYIASSLKEMRGTREKLQENYKMLGLQEMIRQANIDQRWNEIDYQTKQRADIYKDQNQTRKEISDKEMAFREGLSEKEFQQRKELAGINQRYDLTKIGAQGQTQKEIIDTQMEKELTVKKADSVNEVAKYYAKAKAEGKGLTLRDAGTQGNALPNGYKLNEEDVLQAYTWIVDGLKSNPDLMASDPQLAFLQFETKPSKEQMKSVILRYWDKNEDVRLMLQKAFGGESTVPTKESTPTQVSGSFWNNN